MQTEDKKTFIRKVKIIFDILNHFSRKIQYDHVSSFAGHAALFLLTSLFPMAMFCIAVFSYLPIDTSWFLQDFFRVIPPEFMPLINQILEEARVEGTTIVTSFTMLVMLFCASKGVYAVIIGMNAVYGIRETRSAVTLYALAIVYVVIFFSAIGLMMVLIVLGNHIFSWFLHFIPGLAQFDVIFKYGKYACMLILLIIFFMLVYMNIPNRKSHLRYELPGALFSTIVWLAFSWAFSFYISNFAQYSVTYGSLATIVIFILWLYGTMNIIFVGAEINVVLRKFAECGNDYKRVIVYYQNQYRGDLPGQKGIVIRFKAGKHRKKEGDK